MQYSENFGLKEPEYGEKAKVDDLNFNTEKIDTIMGNNRSMIAEYFDQTQSYLAGKVVQLNGKTYRFKVDHAPGNFNPSEVDEEPLGNFIGEGGGSADVTKTASGNPITFDDGADAPLVKCTTEIQGSQDLHGYDKPWVGGAGKNKLPNIMESPQTVNGITATPNDDGTITINGTATANTNIYFNNRFILPQGSYIFSGSNGGSSSTYGLFLNNGSDNLFVYDGEVSFTSDGVTQIYVAIRVVSGVTVNNVKLYPMLRASGTTADFAPYSNICPITAYTEGEIEVSDGDGNTTTHTTTYPSAIYRGSEDVVKGEVTTERKVKTVSASYTTRLYSVLNDTCARIGIVVSDMYPPTYGNTEEETDLHCNIGNPSANPTHSASTSQVGECCMYKDGSYVLFVYAVPIASGGSASDAKQWLIDNNCTFEYPVATPTTSSVTPTNLPIKSLSGYNHIESSTGDMEVEYITEEYQPLVDLIESNSGKHVYSTNEQVVGTWTDGRNVYERVLTGTMGNNSQISIDLATELGCDMVVDIKGWIVATDSTNQIWMHDSYVRFFVQGVSNLILNKNDAGNYGYDNPYTFIIRYTKPTTPTRSLNLTKSAVEEIPDEIKNAEYEEKPDVNEADDDAPTEVDER